MSEWKTKKWRDVLKIINGKNQKGVIDVNGIYPIYGSGGIMAYANDFLCNENTTVVGRKGTINSPIYVETKFWNVDTAFGISAGKELNAKYLHYFCLGYNFTKHNKSTTLPSLAKNDLLEIEISFPDIAEQERIVYKLDQIFQKIDQSIILLEENLNNSKALINSVLDEEFQKLEAVYERKPLSEIVTVINGRAYKRIEMLDIGKYPILRVGNFFSNREWFYSNMELEDNKYCEKGDLLYAWSASFGPKIWDGGKSIYHYHIWKLVPILESISKEFLYYLLERDTDKIKEEGGRGVGMIHITKGDIEKRMIVLPPLEIQISVVEHIKKIYNLHEKLTEELKVKLDNIRDLKSSLLDRAFKGEL